jgi:general secretion pathway protein L
MEYCFIQPDPVNPAQASWLLHSPGSSPGIPQQGSLSDGIIHAKNTPIVLVLPGEDILITQVKLPIRQMAKLRKAIPYALEEKLAADVDELHFAIGPRNEDIIDVAIIEQQRLDDWLEPFRKKQVTPRAIVPDVLSLPWKAGEWTVLQNEDRALVRTGQCAGFCCDRDNTETLLSTLLESEEQPQFIRYYPCDTKTTLRLSSDTPEVNIQACDWSPLRIFAHGWHPQLSLNLLQGDYNAQKDLAKTLKPWRWAALFLGLWLAAGFTQKIIERQQLQQQLSHLKSQAETIFRQRFPNVKRIVNPRAQMEQRLKSLKGADQNPGDVFLEMLTKSGKVLGTQPSHSLDDISYHNGQLNFKISTNNLSQLDSLKQALQKGTGLATELTSADSSKDQATGLIRLKKK